MDKYDKILTTLLSKFYTDHRTDEAVRRIVQETINAEMNKLDKARARGILQELNSIIEKEAELKSKTKI